MTDVLSFDINEYSVDKIEKAISESIINFQISEKIKDKKILFKPNFLFASSPQQALITHPDVIKACIKSFSKYSDKLYITDSPGWGNLNSVLEKIDIKDFLVSNNVKILGDTEFEETEINGKVLKKTKMIRGISEIEYIVNLPKMKTHLMTGLTGAVKNLFGLIHGKTKAKLHFKYSDPKNFYKMLFDIAEYITPVLNIMDGIVGLEGEGPGTGGVPKKIGKLLISDNAVKLDLYFAKMVSYQSFIDTYIDNYKEYLGYVNNLEVDEKELEIPQKNVGMLRLIPLPKFILNFIRNNSLPFPEIDSEKCVKCLRCMNNCPSSPKSIYKSDNKLIKINKKTCIRCYCCHEICPHKSIDLKKTVLNKILSRLFK